MNKIFSVSDVTSLIKNKLENEIPSMYIEGEISEFKSHGSGHQYFTIKDNKSILNCIIWRFTAKKLKITPKVGMNVILFGRLNVYSPQGRYSFIVNSINEKGVGELYKKYEELKNKLQNEGLFNDSNKKEIPKYPLNIGVITSSSGSALQDMLKIFKQYAPHINIILHPAKVQGKNGAETIIKAIKELEKQSELELIIISRGGGSIEDLWEFNKENLARAVYKSNIPIISGVGHETDNTIIDFVSDHRCTTPTNAAEYSVRYWQDLGIKLNQYESQLFQKIDRRLSYDKLRYDQLINSYGFKRPKDIIIKWKEYLNNETKKLQRHVLDKIENITTKLNYGIKQLNAYNPDNIIKKGYSIVYNIDGKVIKSIKTVKKNDEINVKINDGTIKSIINELKSN